MGEGPFLDSPPEDVSDEGISGRQRHRGRQRQRSGAYDVPEGALRLEIENDSLSSVGADVPFLAGDADLALVEGLERRSGRRSL
jgi:hypothetical protein